MTKKRNKIWWFVSGAVVVAVFAVLLVIQMSSNKSTNITGATNSQTAPQFSLQSTQGTISLAQYKTKNVVLYFYESNS